jgi:dipeptidyl-peptidase-4
MRPAPPITLLAAASLFAPALAVSGAAPTPKKALTLERVYAAEPLVEPAPTALRWRDATRFTYLKKAGSGPEAKAVLWEEDAETGKARRILEAIPAEGLGKDGKPRAFPVDGAIWNEAGTALLVTAEKDLWIYEPGANATRRLTNDEVEEELPGFSPDGAKVAFVKGNDLWFVEVATGKLTRLTSDGSPTLLNGRLDWVYEEELAGRGDGRAYEWAPDSSAIAFLRLDQSKVPEYPLVDFLPTNGKYLPQRYPKPGDPNASPSVKVVAWGGSDGTMTSRALDFDGNDILLGPDLSWTPDSSAVAFTKMNRTQTRIEAFLLPRAGDGAGSCTSGATGWTARSSPQSRRGSGRSTATRSSTRRRARSFSPPPRRTPARGISTESASTVPASPSSRSTRGRTRRSPPPAAGSSSTPGRTSTPPRASS